MNGNRHTGISQYTKEERDDRLRLKTSIEAVRLLCIQAMSYSGHDELSSYHDSDTFIGLLTLLSRWNPKIRDVVLGNAPQDAQYTSPEFQREVLHIFAGKVKAKIREEVGDAKFCVMYEEIKDVADTDQITVAIVVRFVDVKGFLRERFLDIVLVDDNDSHPMLKQISAETLKKAICDALIKYNLDIRNMRGQGYDGANNTRLSWKKVPSLFLEDSPHAYFVHGFAYELEPALVAATIGEVDVYKFFDSLDRFITVITHPITLGQLQSAEAIELANMVATGGRGVNQIGNLQGTGMINWNCHFEAICRIIDMYTPVLDVLQYIVDECTYNSKQTDASRCSEDMWSFEFVFVLHLMHRITLITEFLCKALRRENLDIAKTMDYVRNTKKLLLTLRENGFDDVLMDSKSFCTVHHVETPNMSDPTRFAKRLKRRKEKDDITEEQYYHNVFNATISHQLEELNHKFSDDAIELLRLSSALEPKGNFKSFDADHIYMLAKKFYPGDFSEQEMDCLFNQLQDYKLDIIHHTRFQGMTTMTELCCRLVDTNKAHQYSMIDRLIRLVLTLPVSTPTTERAVSAMNDVKLVVCDKWGQEDYLTDSMVPYIEREIAESIETASIIDEFYFKRKNKVGPGV